MKQPNRLAITALCALLPLAAQAHPGHETHASFVAGLAHPFAGWDHLAVLLSLGVLAADRGARLASGVGALVILSMTAGALLGRLFPEAAFVEPAVMATVVASALLLLFRVHLGRAGLLASCLAFTVLHGMTHGQEAPAGDVAGFFAGMDVAAAVLLGMGMCAPRMLRGRRSHGLPVRR